MKIKKQKLLQLFLISQFLWTSVYTPVAYSQVPPTGSNAGDWNVYQTIINDEDQYINLLLIIDTSDTMNQPESWRPYPGSYNSHIEYLWNDPRFINTIAVAEPIVPVSLSTLTSGSELQQVRRGYWSYRLTEADAGLLDHNERHNKRIQLRDAALAEAGEDVNLVFGSSPSVSVPKSIYRNYGGPVTEAEELRDFNMGFDSSWVYWVLNGTVDHTNIYQSPYLYSTSFSKFKGASSSIAGTRATIPYSGDLHYGAFNDIDAFGTDHPIANTEKFNLCNTSRYNPSAKKLTGLGVIAEGIKPSTTYAPAWSRVSIIDSASVESNQAVTPITLFNLGYAKNLSMARLDPYYYSIQTRQKWLDDYPGAGLVDDFRTVWPPVGNINEDHYFVYASHYRFQPGYLDLRCWNTSGTLETYTYNGDTKPKTLLGETNATDSTCNYAAINPPARDNFYSSKSTDGEFANSNPFNKNQAFGTTGQPIRVLKQRFINGKEVDEDGNEVASQPPNISSVTPLRRKYEVNYGQCGNVTTVNTSTTKRTTANLSVGSYTDYLCNSDNTTSDLKLGWTKLYSDHGGFIHARALYQLATQLIVPTSITDRASVVENMLKVYNVEKLDDSSTSSRWGVDNKGVKIDKNNPDIQPRLIDQVLFSGWLGTRDCYEHGLTTGRCASLPSTEEYATGTPAYFDHTRSTYHYFETPDFSRTTTNISSNCYKSDGSIVLCNKFIDNHGNDYDSENNWFNPVNGRTLNEDDFYDPEHGYSPTSIDIGCYEDGDPVKKDTPGNYDTKALCEARTAPSSAPSSTPSSTPSQWRWVVPQPAVQVRKAPKAYVRTGTLILEDPNSDTTMQNSSFGYGNILTFDASDTRGDVWPNNRDNIALGAVTIFKELPRIRRVANCEADTTQIEYAATEAAQGSNSANQWFTNFTCSPASSYDNTKDCQIYDASDNTWKGIGERVEDFDGQTIIVRQSICTEQYGLPDPECDQPQSAGNVIRKYGAGECGFFSQKGNFEGASNVISYGLSCSALEGNNVYLIDWARALGHSNGFASHNTMTTAYQNWLNNNTNNIGQTIFLPPGVDKDHISLEHIGNLTRSNVDDNECSRTYSWEAPALTDPTNLCRMSLGSNMDASNDFGDLFEHGFYTRLAGINRRYHNTGLASQNAASCGAIDPNIDLDSIACKTPATLAKPHDNGYLVVTGESSVATALAAARNNATCHDGVTGSHISIDRSSTEYGGWKGELPFYVFEAYNVDKYGTWLNLDDGHNFGSIFADPRNGRYMPHLFHHCADDDPKIGVGMTTNWDHTTTTTPEITNKKEFSNFYHFANQALEYVKVSTPSSLPSTGLSTAYPTQNLTGATSNVDLYSVNYLNYVFGPKYNGSPIGRRTRIQVAQDVLAQVIATTDDNIRIGLMSFAYSDSIRTQGGYVVRKIDTLDSVNCFEKTLNGTLTNSTEITLSAGSKPDLWIEMVPPEDASGTPVIPEDFIRSVTRTGGVIFKDSANNEYPPVGITKIENTNGEMVLTSPAPVANGIVNFKIQDCYMPNYPELAPNGHRKRLIDSLYSLKAVSQTPLTETLYEAYLYFTGGTPQFGRKSVADAEAFASDNITSGDYISPMDSLAAELNDRDACMLNFILIVTDGYPYDDASANEYLVGLRSPAFASHSAQVAVNLANDNTGFIAAGEKMSEPVIKHDSSSVFATTQFRDPATGYPYGFVDEFFSRANTSLFDELSYFLGNADIATSGINSRQNIQMSVVTMDVDCAPVIVNGLKWNNGNLCNTVFSAEDFLDALEDLFNSVNKWIPSASAVSVPLPATNRASSSTDVYIGLFRPQNLRVWSGNLKKYQLGFGPKDCGFDFSYNPVDICMIAKYAIANYTVNGVNVSLRNALTRPSTENDLTFQRNAVDFFSTATGIASEGLDPLAGGINSQFQDGGYPTPSSGNVYTFMSGTSGTNTITPNNVLTDNQNRVSTTNTTLINYSNFESASGTSVPSSQAISTVRFMLGATPSSASTSTPTLRTNAHGDVMHSNPVTVTYLGSSNSKYTRLFYQTGLGDLVSVEDTNTANNNANSGQVKWRFYPEESLQKQVILHQAFSNAGGDTKIFGADGAVVQLIIDKNKDGFVDTTHDRAYIAFGMRRGARAVYMLDVTNPDSPKLQWKISKDNFCTTGDSTSFKCVDASDIGTSSSGGVPANIPKDFLDELGFTWSTPVLGFVNYKPVYTTSSLQNIINIKNGLQPVAIFGGGYDPEEDNAVRNPANLEMGRALYVVDALTGIPLKMWYRQGNKTTNNPSGNTPSSNDRVGKFARYVSSGTCKQIETASTSNNNIPLYYPFASTAYTFNVDFDTQNTLDRIYIGDLGGQVWRFDIGDKDKDNWVGQLFADLNINVARSDINWDASSNLLNGTQNGIRKQSRKIFYPPVRVGWTREEISYDYIYVTTGDIEHPLEINGHDITAVILDPEIGITSRCAPYRGLSIRDITNVGRIDLNSDGKIDRDDLPKAASTGAIYPITYENISKSPYTISQLRNSYSGVDNTYYRNAGTRGWYYRMERGEKSASQPRIINGVLSWTAFAPRFSALPCSRGTGTKYYLDAFYGTTVDTNLDGLVNNCLKTADETNALQKSHSRDYPANFPGVSSPSAANKISDDVENLLRTPEFLPQRATPPKNIGAGAKSTHCDSPRPIYSTSYGLLPADNQVVHDGKIYRVGFVPQGNSSPGIYDENLEFLGPDFQSSRPSFGQGASTGPQPLPNTPSSWTGSGGQGSVPSNTINQIDQSSSQGYGKFESKTHRPGQLYWFRDDLQ